MKKVDIIRNEFLGYLIYIQLMASLNPDQKNNITDKDFNKNLFDLYDYVKSATNYELKIKQHKLRTIIKKMVSSYTRLFPLKVKIEEIADWFDNLFHENPNLYSDGIEYGVLQSFMDVKK